MSEKALLVRGKNQRKEGAMVEEIREVEVLYQKFIRKPLNEVVTIFEKQNPKMKKQTRVTKGKLEIVFTSFDVKWRRTRRGKEVGLLRYVFSPESSQSCFLEIRREWVSSEE